MAIAQHCPELRCLLLAWCWLVTDRGVTALLRSLQWVLGGIPWPSLCIECSPPLPRDGRPDARFLRLLDLTGLKTISDDSVLNLLEPTVLPDLQVGEPAVLLNMR